MNLKKRTIALCRNIPNKIKRLGEWFKMAAGHLRLVILGYVMAVVLGSGIFYFIELRGRGFSFLQALYWGQVTGTTTGYGDISPVSDWGMVLSIIYLGGVSMFLLAVLVANLITKLLPDPHLFEDKEQKEVIERLRRAEERQIWISEALTQIAVRLNVPLPDEPTYPTSETSQNANATT